MSPHTIFDRSRKAGVLLLLMICFTLAVFCLRTNCTRRGGLLDVIGDLETRSCIDRVVSDQKPHYYIDVNGIVNTDHHGHVVVKGYVASCFQSGEFDICDASDLSNPASQKTLLKVWIEDKGGAFVGLAGLGVVPGACVFVTGRMDYQAGVRIKASKVFVEKKR